MKHYGDKTKLSGYDLPAVDCITGGSPCQDLSVAGKRAGLDGERSGLFMEQIRIIKEMRENDRRNGRTDEFVRPRYMVWENVPGAFSSNGGEDFRIVLEETAKVADPTASIPRPEGGAVDSFRSRIGKRIQLGLASTRRTVLGKDHQRQRHWRCYPDGDTAASPKNRACRRFWRPIRTGDFI